MAEREHAESRLGVVQPNFVILFLLPFSAIFQSFICGEGD